MNVRAGFSLRAVRQDRGGVRVLDGVDLDVRAGGVTAIIGSSGAGKTTLLRLLNRLDDPVSGEVRYDGRFLTDYPIRELRRRVGFVFQTPVMFEGTVAENLRVSMELTGSARAGSARVCAVLESAGLDVSYLARQSSALSIGQQQRVTVARALLADPETLLLDEPTSALDPHSAEQLLDAIRKLCDELKLTVVMVTHRHGEAQRIADRVVVLARGRVAAEGPPRVVFSGPPRYAETA